MNGNGWSAVHHVMRGATAQNWFTSSEMVDVEMDYGAYTCTHCWLEFDTMHDLRSHQRVHVAEGWILDKPPKCKTGPELLFYCHYCNFSADAKWRVRSHLTKHMRSSKKYPYECGTCGFRGRKLYHLESHKRAHTEYRAFECNHCGHQTKSKALLKKHIESMHIGLKPFACSKCDYRATYKNLLKRHMISKHTGKKYYSCEQCKYQSKHLSNLQQHQFVHSGQKKFVCTECNYSTNYNKDLRDHMVVHTGWKPYQCSLCDYKSSNIKYLKSHMRVHTGERPFKCGLCQNAYSHRSTLRKHMDAHYRVYRYKCPFCPYKTQYQTSIQYHEKLHQGDRPHNCPHCYRRFIDISALNNHMRTHTGEAPYRCGICKRHFRFRGTWKLHLKKCDPDHPALRARRILIERLPKKEATKKIIAAIASGKPQSHERTILDFINKNRVVPDTDDSVHNSDEDHENSDPNEDAESVMVIETGPKSPLFISSESDSDYPHTPAATTSKTTLPATESALLETSSKSTLKKATLSNLSTQPTKTSQIDPSTPEEDAAITRRTTLPTKEWGQTSDERTPIILKKPPPKTANSSYQLKQPMKVSQICQKPSLPETSHRSVYNTTAQPAATTRKTSLPTRESTKTSAKLMFTPRLLKIPLPVKEAMSTVANQQTTIRQMNHNYPKWPNTFHTNHVQGNVETVSARMTKSAISPPSILMKPLPKTATSSNQLNQPMKIIQIGHNKPSLPETSHGTVATIPQPAATTPQPAATTPQPAAITWKTSLPTRESTKTSAKLMFTPRLLKIPLPIKEVMSTVANQQTTLSQINHNNRKWPDMSHTNLVQGTGETVITRTTESAVLEFIIEPNETIQPDDIIPPHFMSNLPAAPVSSAIFPHKANQNVPNSSTYQFFDDDTEIGEYATI